MALLEAGIAGNRENPALNRDMNLMLEAIRAAGVLPGAAADPASETEPGQGGQEGKAESHFLLSVYRKPMA